MTAPDIAALVAELRRKAEGSHIVEGVLWQDVVALLDALDAAQRERDAAFARAEKAIIGAMETVNEAESERDSLRAQLATAEALLATECSLSLNSVNAMLAAQAERDRLKEAVQWVANFVEQEWQALRARGCDNDAPAAVPFVVAYAKLTAALAPVKP